MKQYIESLVNTMTMYRVTLYAVATISSVALGLSSISVIDFPVIGLLLSLSIILAVSLFANWLFAWTFSTSFNVESWRITSLILFLLLPPVVSPQAALAAAAAAFIAAGSKYLLAVHGRHVFNPTAIAVFIVGLSGLTSAIWWVATPVLLPVVALAGLFVVAKTRRYAMVATFLVVSLTITLLVSGSKGIAALEALRYLVLSTPLIFFATIMLVEPLTAPSTRRSQMIYAVLVGGLFAAQIEFLSAPATALVIGNLFALLIGAQASAKLKIIDIHKLGHYTYEIIGEPSRTLRFSPGQYAEIDLPHSPSDLKGVRRMFSIASSPHEHVVRFGTTHRQQMSSFKKALMDSEGKTIRITQIGGDFTLPASKAIPVVMIAGGIGITPFRSMLAHLVELQEYRDIVLLYGVETEESVVYQDILDAARGIGATVVPIIHRPHKTWKGEAGMIDYTLINKYVPHVKDAYFYISGPPSMVNSVRTQLRKKGINRRHIKTDYFNGY